MQRRTFLRTNEFLRTSECLVSNNGIFFAVMKPDGNLAVFRGSGVQDTHSYLWGCLTKSAPRGDHFAVVQSDGNLVVYRGTGPGDNRGGVWGAFMESQGQGQYYLILQDDGNLCVYRGADPESRKSNKPVWASGVVDEVTGMKVRSVEYQLKDENGNHIEAVPDGKVELFRTRARNFSSAKGGQSATQSYSKSLELMRGWFAGGELSVTVTAGFKAQVPFIAESKVDVSVGVTANFQLNGSETTVETWEFSVPTNVEAGQNTMAVVAATISKIDVPFTMKARYTLKSGAELDGVTYGTFAGSTSHDLTVTWTDIDPATGKELARSDAQPLLDADLVARESKSEKEAAKVGA